MPGTDSSKGFTLIELLLAMAISAFVALIAYQGLRVSIDAAARVEEESRLLADIELVLGILERDISQSIARPVRTELGNLSPILSGGLSNEAILEFTRDGWGNPGRQRRSELARINYQWLDASLIRQRWMVLDRVSLEEGLEEVVLLGGVEDFQVEFFTPYMSDTSQDPLPTNGLNGDWVDWWDSAQLGLDYAEPLPPAIRVTLVISGFGQITRIIPIASA